MPRPIHIVFDLDDTLYPEREFARSGFRAAAAWAEAELGLKDLHLDMERLLDEGHLGGLFAMALRLHAPAHSADHLQALIAAYRACEPTLTLFDDARFALDHFGAAGPLGLITDGTHAMQQKKVRALAIEARFRHIVFTDALGEGRRYAKPHPLAFEMMAATLGTPEDRYVYVGDNPVKDFVAPNALGWATVHIERTGGIHDQKRSIPGGAPQHRIASLHELPDIIARL